MVLYEIYSVKSRVANTVAEQLLKVALNKLNKQTFENFKCGSQYYRFFFLSSTQLKCQLFNTSVAMYNVNETSIAGL